MEIFVFFYPDSKWWKTIRFSVILGCHHICKSLKGIVCIFCFLLFEIIRNITGNGQCPKMCTILEVKPRIVCFLTKFENRAVSEESYIFPKQQPFWISCTCHFQKFNKFSCNTCVIPELNNKVSNIDTYHFQSEICS